MSEQPSTTCLLGLGTNLGDREGHLRQAVRHLADVLRVTALSPVYETPPWGMQDQPDFLNACVAGETALTPMGLLAAIKQIEQRMGREPAVRWGPRLIDIDLLFYDGVVLDAPGLTVPHPRLAERGFVLRPLADIAPAFRHPVLGRTVAELLEALETEAYRPVDFDWSPEEAPHG